tara:strand:- start:2278 stop:2505 length:228 start_codon:yes stop_codon:yes gene_type:complete
MTKTALSDLKSKAIFSRGDKVYVRYIIDYEDDSDGINDIINKELLISNNPDETMSNLESLANTKIRDYENTLLGE